MFSSVADRCLSFFGETLGVDVVEVSLKRKLLGLFNGDKRGVDDVPIDALPSVSNDGGASILLVFLLLLPLIARDDILEFDVDLIIPVGC